MSPSRVAAIVLRQFYLLRGNGVRLLPMIAWVGIDIVLWGFITRYLNSVAGGKVNFVPANPEVKTDPAVAEVLKGANIFPIDDEYAGANRKRIVDRWVKEVLP